MLDHFGAEIAYALIVELGLVLQVRAAGDIQRAARQAFVHRQHEAEAGDAALVAERLVQRFTQRQAGVFHRVVIVDIQIAFDVDLHAEAAVGGDLIQHVVEEADAGFDLAAAFAIQPDVDVDLRLFGHAINPRVAIAQGQLAHDLPAQHAALVAQPLDAHVFCQLHVGRPIADHVAVGGIQHTGFEVTLHQRGFRLAAVAVVRRQVRADQHIGELNALRAEDLHHQVVRRIEGFLRETGGAEPILIGDHHQLIPRLLQRQRRDHVRLERQLVQAVNLEIFRWLGDQRAVTIDKEDFWLTLAPGESGWRRAGRTRRPPRVDIRRGCLW